MAPINNYLKTPHELEKMRKAGKILAGALSTLQASAEEGIALLDLDSLAYGLIKKAGGEPAFFGYHPGGAARPFPATLCTSIDDVIVHGIPTKRRLKNGNILKLDLGVKYEGYYADAAVTIAIGNVSETGLKLIHVTREALEVAIALAKPGNTLGDIGYVINKLALDHGFKVAKGLTGHGIGKELHEDPSVFNEGRPGKGIVLEAGMAIAIEPMIVTGSGLIIQKNDDSYATADKSLAAHFEHTIVITEKGSEIITVI